MCIRDRFLGAWRGVGHERWGKFAVVGLGQLVERGIAPALACLLYTSDAADERSSVDLGGRRIIKKKTQVKQRERDLIHTN